MSLNIGDGNPLFKKSGNNVVFSLRIDENVYDVIKQVAETEGRSINTQLLRFIEGGLIEYLEEHDN